MCLDDARLFTRLRTLKASVIAGGLRIVVGTTGALAFE